MATASTIIMTTFQTILRHRLILMVMAIPTSGMKMRRRKKSQIHLCRWMRFLMILRNGRTPMEMELVTMRIPMTTTMVLRTRMMSFL